MRHYGISFTSSIREQELKNRLLKYLVDEELLEEEALNSIVAVKIDVVRT